MNTKYSCGGCTACCTTHGVHSIQKQPGEQCPSCTAGEGCTIYKQRPEECRNFTCSWILGNGGQPERRPDKTGVVPVHEIIPGAGVILSLYEYQRGALKSEFIFNWTRRNLLRGDFTIHHPLSRVMNVRFFLPRSEENISEETRHVFEEHWGRKVDLIYYKSYLHGVIL